MTAAHRLDRNGLMFVSNGSLSSHASDISATYFTLLGSIIALDIKLNTFKLSFPVIAPCAPLIKLRS